MPKKTADEATVDAGVSEVTSVESVSVKSVDTIFAELYEKASQPFDKTYQRQIPGGRMLTYITGEQVVSRMNEVFGPYWDWNPGDPTIKDDEIYLSGTLTVNIPDKSYGYTISRSAFGGASIKRKRDGGMLSLGNDIKAADTDAFKKAAAKFGVGLYLSERSDDGGESELPNYSTQKPFSAPQGLAQVQFPQNNTNGNSTTGPIEAISAPSVGPDGRQRLGGVKVQGQWYNVSSQNPIQVTQFQRGQLVTVGHAPGKNFIDSLSTADAVQEATEAF